MIPIREEVNAMDNQFLANSSEKTKTSDVSESSKQNQDESILNKSSVEITTSNKQIFNSVVGKDELDNQETMGVSLMVSDDEEIFPINEPEPRSRSRSGKKRKKSSRSRSRSRNKRSRSRSPADEDKAKKYKSDPFVQKMVQDLVSKQVARQISQIKDQLKQGKSNLEESSGKQNRLKSPSDSTLYTPAIQRMDNLDDQNLGNLWERQDALIRTPTNVVNLVNDGISQIRINLGQAEANQPRPGTSRSDQPQPSTSRQQNATGRFNADQMGEARTAAENAILQAEQFKARIQPPTGIRFNNTYGLEIEKLRQMRYLDCEDDEFFHTTCHIESGLKQKIERGEFVELEKLLQRKLDPNKDKRLHLVNRDGESFFVPASDREAKIDNVKKWEQAFRVYTTIYCHANPLRSAEILQYVDIINRAAQIFSWDNVAKYDYVFRQLMAAKPHRSWAKTYTQMWNITLNEPIKNSKTMEMAVAMGVVIGITKRKRGTVFVGDSTRIVALLEKAASLNTNVLIVVPMVTQYLNVRKRGTRGINKKINKSNQSDFRTRSTVL